MMKEITKSIIALVAFFLVMGAFHFFIYEEKEVTISIEDINHDFIVNVDSFDQFIENQNLPVLKVKDRDEFLMLSGDEKIWLSSEFSNNKDKLNLYYWFYSNEHVKHIILYGEEYDSSLGLFDNPYQLEKTESNVVVIKSQNIYLLFALIAILIVILIIGQLIIFFGVSYFYKFSI